MLHGLAELVPATSRPVRRLASRSRTAARRDCSSRMNSPVPTTSCQRATTSPRRSEPLRSASSTSCRADAYARSASERRPAAAASCSAAARSTAPARAGRLRARRSTSGGPDRLEPARRGRARRASAGPAQDRRERADRPRGRSPGRRAARRRSAGTHHLGQVRCDLALGVARHAVEHERECRARSAPSRGAPTARRPRSEPPSSRTARRRRRRSSCVASTRFSARTESMSGESSSAIPGDRASTGRRNSVPGPGEPPVTLGSLGRILSSSNQRRSSGWHTRTGPRVVGRRTPDRLISAPTRLLTIVDFPAPVEPSHDHQDGRLHLLESRKEVVVGLPDDLVARGLGGRCVGQLEIQAERRRRPSRAALR